MVPMYRTGYYIEYPLIIHYGKEDVKEHSLKNRYEPYTWNRPALHPTSAS